MKIPVTEWFPSEVKPSIVGWYERDWQGAFDAADYWDGENWRNGNDNNTYSNLIALNNKQWRGLTSPHPEWKP